ncbi:methionine ABC transporter membrane-anchored lipoprotein MetQ, partial [Serratia marcescens]
MTFTLKNLTLALAAAGTLLLTACGPTAQDDHHIKVGISAGIDQSLWAVV